LLAVGPSAALLSQMNILVAMCALVFNTGFYPGHHMANHFLEILVPDPGYLQKLWIGIEMNAKSIWLLLLIAFWATFFTPTFTVASDDIIVARDGQFFFKSQDSTLKEIVEEFNKKYSIEIKGLEGRESEKITFLFQAETLETLLKGLLRHLDVKNYAIEFADATLERVVVVPGPTRVVAKTLKPPADEQEAAKFVDVAQIQSIIASSQAETLDLLEGDIIIEYDGVLITSARQLVAEVEKKAAKDRVEMVIVREKVPQRLTLSGGFIGIRVKTTKIPKEEFNTYYLSE
jgi:hypothetical protein